MEEQQAWVKVWPLYIERIRHVDHFVYRVEVWSAKGDCVRRHIFVPVEAGDAEWRFIIADQYPGTPVVYQEMLPWNVSEEDELPF